MLGHYGAQLNSSSLRLLHWKYILQFREIHLATLTNINKGGSDSGHYGASLASTHPPPLLDCSAALSWGGKVTFMFQIDISQNKHNAKLFKKTFIE